MNIETKWDEDLYKEIEEKVNNNIPKLENLREFRIDDEKFSKYECEVEEEYYVHPDGEYQKSKSDLKKDDKFRNRNLYRITHYIPYHGHVIQEAIDEAEKCGGGRVVIPGGVSAEQPKIYYTGAIYLRSNVELHVEENAILKFVRTKKNEFYPMVYTRWEGVELMNFSPFIYSYEEENIAITGNGILDGCADEYNWMPWKFGYFNEISQDEQRNILFELGERGADVRTSRIFNDDVSTIRPPFIQPYNCKNILIKDITILNSPFWEVNPVLCENIKVTNIKVNTNLYNNDGVDPESCKDVIIEHCYFLTGDDCIAIKSGRNNEGRRIGVPCERIIIRNNEFKDGHGGITIGSEISGGVNTVFAHDNYFDSKNLDYPIRFKTNAERGGKIEDIYVKNSTVNKSKVAVIHADFFYEEGMQGNHMPILRNIILSNIKTIKGGSIDAKNALFIKGFENAPIENIVIEDADLKGVQGSSILRNVKNLTFKNVSINGEKIKDKTISIDDNSNEIQAS